MHGVFFRVTFSRNPWLSLLDADEAWMASGEAELVKKNVFYKKHPKFSKVHADSQEAFELLCCPLFLHYSTRVYRSYVKKSVSPLNAARNVKNDHPFHGSTTNCPAFHRDTSWSRDSRPIFSEGGGGFSP